MREKENKMKNLISFLALILFVVMTSLASAQTNTKNPNAHEVHKNLRKQMRQIQQDLKSGKITESEAKARREKIRSVHQQDKQFRHQNGGKDLTAAQSNQLKSSLGGVQN